MRGGGPCLRPADGRDGGARREGCRSRDRRDGPSGPAGRRIRDGELGRRATRRGCRGWRPGRATRRERRGGSGRAAGRRARGVGPGDGCRGRDRGHRFDGEEQGKSRRQGTPAAGRDLHARSIDACPHHIAGSVVPARIGAGSGSRCSRVRSGRDRASTRPGPPLAGCQPPVPAAAVRTDLTAASNDGAQGPWLASTYGDSWISS
jgi:hypothetical protein